VICGFVKTDEKSINEYTACTLGKLLDNLIKTNPNSPMVKLYEPHKNVHFFSKKIIRDINNKDRSNVENDIRELNANMSILIEGLRKATL